MLESNLSAASSGQTAGQSLSLPIFFSAQPEAHKCGKLIRFAFLYFDLDGNSC
jgi:hypothetical protein